MSEEQLSALLAKLKDDAGLLEKLKGAADIDTAQSIATEAGFDVSEADWLRYQQGMGEGELSDEELDGVAGGCGGGVKAKKEQGSRPPGSRPPAPGAMGG